MATLKNTSGSASGKNEEPFEEAASEPRRRPLASGYKHLNRADLLEIVANLNEDCMRLEAENAELRSQLEDRWTRMSKAGSIAEATVAIQGLFEKAQATADQYIEETKSLRTQMRHRLNQIERLCEQVESVESGIMDSRELKILAAYVRTLMDDEARKGGFQ